MWVPSWSLTCQEPPTFSTPRFIVSKDVFITARLTYLYMPAVRTVPQSIRFHPIVSKPPFWLEGTPNVFLETIKRGEDDDFESKSASKTVILRLYEAYGGHGHVQLRVSPSVRVVDAYLTNLLEDHKTALLLVSDVNAGVDENETAVAASLDLEFRGFEVKTVKLVVADQVFGVESDDGVRCDVRVFFFCGVRAEGHSNDWSSVFCSASKRESWVTVEEE